MPAETRLLLRRTPALATMKIFSTLLLAGLLVPQAGAAPPTTEIEWFPGPHMSALGRARKESRMVVLYFWMEGSAQCARMYKETLQSPTVVDPFKQPICLSVDIASAGGAKLVQKYGITTLPTLLFLSPQGEREEAVLGFIPAPSLLAEWSRIQAGTGTVSDFRRRAQADPGNLALKHSLALKLQDVGDQAGHDLLVGEIRQEDPTGQTTTGARLFFWEVRTQALSQGSPDQVDLQLVYTHVRGMTLKPIQYEAWNWLAGFEFARSRFKETRAASLEAWAVIAPADVLSFGTLVAQNFWMMREELSAAERKFVVKVARLSGERARAMKDGDDGYGNTDFEGETYEQFLAMNLHAQSMAEFMGGHRKRAIQLVEEALELFPDGEEFPAHLALYQKNGR